MDQPPNGCPSCETMKNGLSCSFEVFEPYLKKFIEIKAFARFDKSNNIIGVVHVVHDITDRRKAEDERTRLMSELNRMNEKLNQKNTELEQIIYASGHDIRTPLVNVVGYVEELDSSLNQLKSLIPAINNSSPINEKLNSILADDIPNSLKFIARNIKRINSQNDALLEYSLISKTVLHKENLDMTLLIKEILRSWKYQIENDNITFDVGELPPCIGDKDQIVRVFKNFIDNSLKYRNPNRPIEISISGIKEDEKVIFCVKDNGIGINSNHFNDIFSLFHQLNPNKSIGEGIGLPIAKRIIELHDGDIWIESILNEGTTFYISLPA